MCSADRAKSIKTKAVINESATDKLIRELREENARLLEMLKQGGGAAGTQQPAPQPLPQQESNAEIDPGSYTLQNLSCKVSHLDVVFFCSELLREMQAKSQSELNEMVSAGTG